MNLRIFALVACLVSGNLLAQEQLAVRLNEQGILKILTMAVKYNSASRQNMVIPQNLYDFKLKKRTVQVNPVVRMIGQLRGLNFNGDLPFYLKTSDINVNGSVDEQSLRLEIFNSTDFGFDVRLSIALPGVAIHGRELELCQNRHPTEKECAPGLKVQMAGLRIATVARPIIISAVLQFRNDGRVARVAVGSVDSNLSGAEAPELDITFESLEVPPENFVDGLFTPTIRNRLRDGIIEQRKYLADKLIAFAAEFLANDVVEMVNRYLIDREVATAYLVQGQGNGGVSFDQFVANRARTPAPPYRPRPVRGNDPMTRMLNQIQDVLASSQVEVSLKRIATPSDKDIELLGLMKFVLGNRMIETQNTLGNSRRALPRLDLSPHRRYDLNLAISEPLINAVLDVANSADLFQKMFESLAPIKGVKVKNVKLHFAGDRALVGVVNVEVDLNKLEARGVRSWLTNRVASFLERNNNNGIIFFPIEVSVTPTFKRLRAGVGLDLRVLSPFTNQELPNRFNYPTNIPLMTDIVKDGVMGELKTALEPHTNKTYSVDLTKYLNKVGVEFLPKSIAINQGAYLTLGIDIVDIKFSAEAAN
jgi:hypothetical protein